MISRKLLFIPFLLASQSTFASIKVNVENDTRHDEIKLLSYDVQTSTYSATPLESMPSQGKSSFHVFSNYPDVVRIVDLEYGFSQPSHRAPKCHFRFVIMKDYRSGNFLPQRVIAENEGGSFRDKAICAGKMNSFNLTTGNAEVTFSMNRRKF
ncbi:hypothetical protein [Algicola sagamiensis]|uniref:hypothetical protein n=1 Tax=Algicola sagamiensis TaxID=163869 RepID=UPI00039F6B8D|nr:hypothetical protein [Algicola sagamiensis]